MLSEDVVVKFEVQHQDLVHISPDELKINKTDTQKTWPITVKGLNAGHSIVSVNVIPNNVLKYVYFSILDNKIFLKIKLFNLCFFDLQIYHKTIYMRKN